MDYILGRLGRSSQDEKRLHVLLMRVDSDFMPPLSTQVQLDSYCSKLASYAEVIIITSGKDDIGFVAIYANNTENGISFITAIAVDQAHRGCGLGVLLLKEAINVSRTKNMSRIRLEVHPANYTALSLYRKMGFVEIEHPNHSDLKSSILMERPITRDDDH